MRPTTAPSASTSKSSSFHSPDGREAEARLRTRRVIVFGDLQQFVIPNDKEPVERRPMPLLNLCDDTLDLGLPYAPRPDVQIDDEPHPAPVSFFELPCDRFLKCA